MGTTDLFRDTHLRYLGYANEVGESFRTLLPTKAVRFTYGVACAYVGCDAADKGLKEYQKLSPGEYEKRYRRTTVASCDALVWQSFASVIVPGFTINRLCWATHYTLSRGLKQPSLICKGVSVVVSLAAIPFIIKPIDQLVDHCMDLTVRKWVFNTKE